MNRKQLEAKLYEAHSFYTELIHGFVDYGAFSLSELWFEARRYREAELLLLRGDVKEEKPPFKNENYDRLKGCKTKEEIYAAVGMEMECGVDYG
jgi:hypothetical protein